MTDFSLSDLAAIIEARAQSNDSGSYTVKLLECGSTRVARKFGEEAVETVIAAISEDDKALTGEAADLLYHLLVLLKARGIPLSAVMAELAARTGQSGLEEKASRSAGKAT